MIQNLTVRARAQCAMILVLLAVALPDLVALAGSRQQQARGAHCILETKEGNRNEGTECGETTLDNSPEKVGAKIRNAQLQRIAYMLVIGEKEAAIQSVSVRHAKKGDLGVTPLADFLPEVTREVSERSL